MIQALHPLGCPLLRAIAPGASPFTFAPRISKKIFSIGGRRRLTIGLPNPYESLSIDFSGIYDGVCVQPDNAFSINAICTLPCVKTPGPTAEQEFLIHFQEFVGPKFLSIENVGGKQLGCHAARKILDCFSASY